MVHYKDDIKPSPSKQIEHSSDYNENNIVMPEFSIDDDGIPYCTKQPGYEKIIALKKQYPREFEKMLNCKHCDHYKKNDCYFPRSEIDKIEEDRVKQNIRCQLCGMKIDRLFSIIMSELYKDQFDVNLPVICCSCYAGLERGTFESTSKRRMILFFISFITSIYFLSMYFQTILSFTWYSILVIIIPFTFWGYISLRDLKSIYYLYKGRKYYKKIMGAEKREKTKEESFKEKYVDEDDKKKPPEGAFYSPGYEY